MKVRYFLPTVLALGLLVGCAVVPASAGAATVVTFKLETFDTTLRPATFPVDYTYHVPDLFPASAAGRPTPYTFSVSSKEHAKVATSVEVTAHVVAPPGTLVVCTWTATTPSGVRSSERSRGGEGSASVPNGGTEAIAFCRYEA